MKKVIVFILVLSSLCGCTSIKETKPIVNNISFTVNITHQKQEYTCDVQSFSDGLNLIVKDPQNIEGLALDINKNICNIAFEGLNLSYDTNLLPDNAFAQIIYAVLCDVSEQPIFIDDENCTINGNVYKKDYVFVFSPSGLPLSLEIKDLDFNVNFSNVTIK